MQYNVLLCFPTVVLHNRFWQDNPGQHLLSCNLVYPEWNKPPNIDSRYRHSIAPVIVGMQTTYRLCMLHLAANIATKQP